MTLKLFFLVMLVGSATEFASAQSIQSVYTDLGKQCKTLEQKPDEAGYLLQRCPGVAGYKVLLEYGDERVELTIVTPQGKEFPLNIGQQITPAFSDSGAKAEWRMKRDRGKLVPIALIVRITANENSENPEKTTSYMAVSKITQSEICITDRIPPGRTQNEEARRAADAAASKPCRKLE